MLAREGERKGRPGEPLLEPGGDQADHARRPAFARDDDRGAPFLQSQRQQRFRLGFGERGDLDLATGAIDRSSSAAMSRASRSSVVVSSRAPSPASPMRPPALMRADRNPR